MKIYNFLKEKKTLLIGILIVITIIVIDQITKTKALNYMNSLIAKTNNIYTFKPVCSFLNIVLVFNKGVAFGVFNSPTFENIMPHILLILTFCIVAILSYLFIKKQDITTFPFVFVIAGGIGNIIDRIKIGSVIDFIDFYIKDYHWPAFNIADSAICIGAILFFVIDIIVSRKTSK